MLKDRFKPLLKKRTIWPPKHYYQTKPFLERRETFHLRPNSMKEHWIYVCDHEISHKIRKVASYAHGNQRISFVDEKFDLLQSTRILSNKIFLASMWRYCILWQSNFNDFYGFRHYLYEFPRKCLFSKKAKFDPYGNVELPNCASSTSHFSQNICA